MSAMSAASLLRFGQTRSLELHSLPRMKASIAAVGLHRTPVGRHPARPAELTEAAEPDRLRRPGRNGQFDVAIVLLAVVEKDEVGQRLAKIASRQQTFVLRKVLGEDAHPDLVLNAEDGAPEKRILAQCAMIAAERAPLGVLQHEPAADELFDF